MLIDTHTHLYMTEYDSDGGGDAAVRRAIEAGVERMIFPNVDRESLSPMLSLAGIFTQNVSVGLGLHPTEVEEDWREECEEIFNADTNGVKVVGIGETGIDLYWEKKHEREQMLAFDYQLDYASKHGLPVIIHCREGLDQTLEVLSGHKDINAVFHSFGGTVQDVDRIRNVGDYWFGINGIVTFKNSKLREVLPEISLDRILLETDAPFLAPVPKRGQRNESAFMVHTANHIAGSLGLNTETVAEATTKNANKLFKL